MANKWENNENSDSFFSWAPKSLQMVTAAMKWRHLLLGRKAMTNLDSILKSRDSTSLTKVHLVKAMVFQWSCESWTIKKAEGWRIDAFKLWCWRRLLRVPWPARSSNQSILNEISPECSVEGLVLKLKLQYLATWCKERTHWCWERLKAGGEGDDRGWDGWMASPPQWSWAWVNSRNWWWTGRLACCSPWGCKESGMTEQLNWTEDWEWRCYCLQRVGAKVLQNITQHTASYIIQNNPPQQLSKFSGPACQLCWDWETPYSRVLSTKPD